MAFAAFILSSLKRFSSISERHLVRFSFRDFNDLVATLGVSGISCEKSCVKTLCYSLQTQKVINLSSCF